LAYDREVETPLAVVFGDNDAAATWIHVYIAMHTCRYPGGGMNRKDREALQILGPGARDWRSAPKGLDRP
jgi:hypothetical protein